MAFHEHKLVVVSNDTGIRCTLRKFRNSPPKFSMSFDKKRADGLNLSHGDKIHLFVGADEDKGKVLIVKNNSTGVFTLKQKSNGKKERLEVDFGHVPAFPDESQGAKFCTRGESASGICIILPSWAHRKGAIQPVAPAANVSAQRAAIDAAKAKVPPPDFSGSQKPKMTKKDAMKAVSVF